MTASFVTLTTREPASRFVLIPPNLVQHTWKGKAMSEDPFEALGTVVKQHLEEGQKLVNDLAQYLATAHPALASDNRIAEFINLLQAGTSALADAHAKLVQPPPAATTTEVVGSEPPANAPK